MESQPRSAMVAHLDQSRTSPNHLTRQPALRLQSSESLQRSVPVGYEVSVTYTGSSSTWAFLPEPGLAPCSVRNFTTVSYLRALAASSAVRPSVAVTLGS